MIEKATLDDLLDIQYIEDEVLKGRWKEKDFRYEFIENPVANMYIYRLNGEIIGYADLWILFERAELVNIAIKKAYQGNGYGDELLSFIERKAIKAGCEFMMLEVRDSNEAAISLYTKHGFKFLRRREKYYEYTGEDAIEMMKIFEV